MSSVPATKPARKPRRTRPARGKARMVVTIIGDKGDETPYAVRPVPCDPASDVARCYRLRKPSGEVYHVSRHEHGCECTCPDFVFSRDGIDPAGCKHVRALAALTLIDADPAPSDPRSWPSWTDARWAITAAIGC